MLRNNVYLICVTKEVVFLSTNSTRALAQDIKTNAENPPQAHGVIQLYTVFIMIKIVVGVSKKLSAVCFVCPFKLRCDTGTERCRTRQLPLCHHFEVLANFWSSPGNVFCQLRCPHCDIRLLKSCDARTVPKMIFSVQKYIYIYDSLWSLRWSIIKGWYDQTLSCNFIGESAGAFGRISSYF